ncbi:MAG: ComF family protein [Patescibacteria group bacterium]
MNIFFSKIINLFFPIQCLGCGKSGFFLCSKCLDSIPLNQHYFCPICHRPGNSWRLCSQCHQNRSLDGVIIASDYKYRLLQKIIHCYKYQYVKSLSKALSQILINYLEDNQVFSDFIITSLPLHLKRQKLRCFNQAEEVANYIADTFWLSFDPDLLKRLKNTKPQARLNKEQRAKNIRNAFRLQRGCYGRRVLIIDDVFTTGSTLNECARVLKEAGAREVWGLVIAKG